MRKWLKVKGSRKKKRHVRDHNRESRSFTMRDSGGRTVKDVLG